MYSFDIVGTAIIVVMHSQSVAQIRQQLNQHFRADRQIISL